MLIGFLWALLLLLLLWILFFFVKNFKISAECFWKFNCNDVFYIVDYNAYTYVFENIPGLNNFPGRCVLAQT